MEFFSEYYNQDDTISKIDARVKILVALSVLAMLLSYRGLALPLLVALICIYICARMRMPLRIFLLRFSEPFFIISIILILKFFFSGKDVLFSVSIMGIEISGHKDGLQEGLKIAYRIIGAVSVVAIIGLSTPFTEIIAGLSWLRVPRGFLEVLIFAFRYIFVLFEDAQVIYSAQKNRLGYSNMRRGLGSFGTLAGSLTLRAFEHSHRITVSMIQRGYDGSIPMLKHKPLEPAQIIVSVLFITAMGFVWKMQ